MNIAKLSLMMIQCTRGKHTIVPQILIDCFQVWLTFRELSNYFFDNNVGHDILLYRLRVRSHNI